jgi:hypothetical protein
MPLSSSALFLMEDSSSLDDSDLEDILFDDDEQLLHGQYCGKNYDPTIILEAVASQDL